MNDWGVSRRGLLAVGTAYCAHSMLANIGMLIVAKK